MVLDIKLFRAEQGGDPELIRESQRRRHKPVEIVDEIIALDEKWRKDTFQLDTLRKEQRIVSKKVGELNSKGGKDSEEAQTLSKRARDMKDEIAALAVAIEQARVTIDKKVALVGNIVHESVPVSNNEDDNALYHEFGQFTKKEGTKNHRELLHMIDGFDPVRGHKVAGHRGYFLKGVGVRLSQAIVSYASDYLNGLGYTLLQTPLFMNKEVMAQTAQLEQFDEELYKVTATSHGTNADKEYYLIATSEQPISAYHADEWLQPKELPLRYGGISSCFRKEAGAAGKDTWGIFRVHQFDKVEQFVLTTPETSWQEHEKMLEVSEQFWQSLEIPYRVVTIVSAELNNAASKKYDLEGWFPGFGEFRELVSCSNCTDYQARSLEVRCGTKAKEDKEKKYVHMLNSTLCALTRTICVILENHQTETGVTVPQVLRKYMGGLDFMPFVLPCPPPPDQPNTVKPGDVKKGAEKGKKEGGEKKEGGGAKKEGGEQKGKGGGGAKKEGGNKQQQQKGGNKGKQPAEKDGAKPATEEKATEAKPVTEATSTTVPTPAATENKAEEKTEEKK